MHTTHILHKVIKLLNLSGCGYLLTEDNGVVMSPKHPLTYPGKLDCNYTISVDPQKFIVLEFDEDQFGIERARVADNSTESMDGK